MSNPAIALPEKQKPQQLHGFLLLDKPEGITSTGLLNKLKHKYKQKKLGHAGTLDPLASGLLPVALGEATKVIRFITDAQKHYSFTVQWGAETDTDDAEGQVTQQSEARPDKAAIEAMLPQFTGTITQLPPAYSAIKINGKRAYDLARAGEKVEMKPREVIIDHLTLLDMPDANHSCFEVTCGKGTYVRAIARDMARALGTHGHITAIRRLGIGKFSVENAFLLENEGENGHTPPLVNWLMPILAALDDIPALQVDASIEHKLRHGQQVSLHDPGLLESGVGDFLTAHKAHIKAHEPICVTREGKLIALCEVVYPQLQPIRVFNI